MIQFNISVDTNKWLRGHKKQRKRIINTRMESARAYSEQIRDWAIYFAPQDTGNLKNSIISEKASSGYRVRVLAKSDTGKYYGQYVEYGTGIYSENGRGRKSPWFYYNKRFGAKVRTRGQRAQPFIRPAIDITNMKSSKILKGVWNKRGLSNR